MSFATLTLYILPPLIGSIIGYITNNLAIMVLFYPYTAKYVFRMNALFDPDISRIDVVETEKCILQVMKMELRAVVWLGAGLGSIMGIINILI